MSDGPEWFAAKRYGIGPGRPISWQGWAIMLAFMALVALAAVRLKSNRLALVSTIATLMLIFLTISAKTTRGGWRWHWGDED